MGKAIFTKDTEAKTLTVEREFSAPRSKVWYAYTTSDILDQWWAPKPWKAGTVAFDFSEGGKWHYYMAGPEGEKHYARFDYETIDPENSFSGYDMFCDENGAKNEELPSIHWNMEFIDNNNTTKLKVTMKFDDIADMEKIIAMGFEQGFDMGLMNLEELLAGSKVL